MMYNANVPDKSELPSTKQLLKSTALALVAAVILLFTVVMPAEYGSDPTGVGRWLGLVEMGEIKASLKEEAELDEAMEAAEDSSSNYQEAPSPAARFGLALLNLVVGEAAAAEDKALTYTLKNNQAVEVKLVMKKGAKVRYRWVSEGGKVNFDTHGDNKKIDYHNYNKGRKVSGDEGKLVAAFTGNHGWFWRNRSGKTVTITLSVEGDYSAVKRVK